MRTDGPPSIVLATLVSAAMLLARAERACGADDPLEALGLRELSGAAAGYVGDAACGECHAELAQSYRQVAMAQAFYRPSDAPSIETFGGKPFVHEKSGQRFEMTRRGGRIVFRRWQVAFDGKPINVFEQQVDWILGSGKHARTYLYRQPNGELYQLPVAWYAQENRWGMAPGYDRADHDGVTRRVRHECMYCHNAYPEAEADLRGYWRSQSFPESLPEGIGCQRCHGPGANHVRAALGGSDDAARAAIVNPSKLDPRRRIEICYGCHMEPAVAMPGIRRFDRDVYGFRPGFPLAEYLLHLDVDDRARPRDERFEINHHPYRLEQSRCFLKSEGRLTCLSCHDPHRVVPAEQRAQHYRVVCRECHALASCSGQKHEGPADCVSCHMPKRRTQDVVHVVMTDHLIRRTPGGDELLAPRDESEPAFDDVTFVSGENAPEGAERELYRAAAVLRATGGESRAALSLLASALETAKPAEIEPYLDLAMALLRQRRFAELEATASAIVSRNPRDAQALEWLGVAKWAAGSRGEGLALLDQAIAIEPLREETLFNRGILTATAGASAQAAPYFEKAVALRPTFAAAWHRLGDARMAEGKTNDAVAAYKKALEIDPRRTDSYIAIGQALEKAGRRAEALRFRKHGATAAAKPELLRSLLEKDAAAKRR
ncbi:MAG: tetratricopeptide repeat protein [Thermoanaerobaculia bacterium]